MRLSSISKTIAEGQGGLTEYLDIDEDRIDS